MIMKTKQLSNPYSTGAGGSNFEARVQTSLVTLMLAGGFAPCLPNKPISQIILQAKHAGYQTDDMIVFVQNSNNETPCKLLCQIKHTIKITENNSIFADVIQSAWLDFINTKIFTRGKDSIALITGPLTVTDTYDVRTILEWARYAVNSKDFFRKVELTNFSSNAKRKKLQAFKANLKKANGGNTVNDDEVFEFLRHFHLLGYDLDIKAGVSLSLLHSLIGQYSIKDVPNIWARILNEVQSANENAGTITINNIHKDLISAFKQRQVQSIPPNLITPKTPKSLNIGSNQIQIATLTIASLIGKWNENAESDTDIIRRLIDGF